MTSTPASPPRPEPEAIRNLLRKVVDPELGVNIVDLGLLYRIDAEPGAIEIDMTMTSPACPMGEMIVDEVRKTLAAAWPGDRIEVRLVWDPPWDPSRMTERSRQHFGW